MKGTIELSPDQLAQLVAAVCEANGLHSYGLALLDKEGQLVGYERAVIHHTFDDGLAVYPRPNISRKELERMLRPDAEQPTFASRNAG